MGFKGKILLLTCLLGGIPAGATSVHYKILGLRPVSVSKYDVPARGAEREYFQFVNGQGNHRIIYEESVVSSPFGSVADIRRVMGSKDLSCDLELSCIEQAFCTGTCQNMYYEMSNTPDDPGLRDRNQCSILSFLCGKGGG